jgi:hypothetical protein
LKPGRPLAAFSDVPVDPVAKPAPVWKAIREHASFPIETATAPTRFLVKVQITDTRESGPAGSVVGIIKPALDGIISAYHSHEGSDGVAETQRLEECGIGTAETLCNHLFDRRWATLGARRLVWPFGAAGGTPPTTIVLPPMSLSAQTRQMQASTPPGGDSPLIER